MSARIHEDRRRGIITEDEWEDEARRPDVETGGSERAGYSVRRQWFGWLGMIMCKENAPECFACDRSSQDASAAHGQLLDSWNGTKEELPQRAGKKELTRNNRRKELQFNRSCSKSSGHDRNVDRLSPAHIHSRI